MENVPTKLDDFRISELIPVKEKRRKDAPVPQKSNFQYIFENACRNIGGRAPSEWRI